MTATVALEKQIERYRQMTGEQRLAVALDLHEMSCEIAREGIRRSHPDAVPAEVEVLLRRQRLRELGVTNQFSPIWKMISRCDAE